MIQIDGARIAESIIPFGRRAYPSDLWFAANSEQASQIKEVQMLCGRVDKATANISGKGGNEVGFAAPDFHGNSQMLPTC